jgi:hypothetical protein
VTEVEADLKGEVFLKIVRGIGLEPWVVIAKIELVPIYEKLIFTPLIHIYPTLLGFKKLGVQIPCVLATHTVATQIPVNVCYNRSIGRKTAFELTIHPACKVASL